VPSLCGSSGGRLHRQGVPDDVCRGDDGGGLAGPTMLPEEGRLTTQSLRIEVGHIAVQQSGPDACGGSGEMDADAAAGGRRHSASVWDSGPPGGCGGRLLQDLRLPIEARSLCGGGGGSSSVASIGQAQLVRSLNDTAALQGRAMAAIDRIAQQQAAMRRFPMACPSCGSLNAPSGMAWGAGDIVACTGCGQSFVPLSHGLQDSDVVVLRTAVQHLWAQAERVQYLEQILRSRTPSQQTPKTARLDAAAAPGSWSPRPAASSSTAASSAVPTAHRAAGDVDLGTEGAVGAGSGDTPSARHISGSTPGSRRPGTPGRRREDPVGVADTPVTHRPQGTSGQSPGTGRTSQLMALTDTLDLVTNSSCSSATPCFHGRKLRQRVLDTEDRAKEAVLQARAAATPGSRTPAAPRNGSDVLAGSSVGASAPASERRHGEREDGEITSTEDSDSIRSWDFRQLGGPAEVLGTPPRRRGGDRGHRPALSPAVGVSASTRGGASASVAEEGPEPGLGAFFGASQRRSAQQLAALFAAAFCVRCVVGHILGAFGASSAMEPAMMCAILTGSTLLAFKVVRQSQDVSQLMETSAPWGLRTVVVRVGGRTWTMCSLEFTLEEAYGLCGVMAQLTMLIFFESWGVHGPRGQRCGTIIVHATSLGLFTLTAHSYLSQQLSHAESGEIAGVAWWCLAMGNWVTTTWASLTWWPVAAVTSAFNEVRASGDSDEPLPMHVPVLSLAAIQLLNFWVARRAHQPGLLSGCVVLAGFSMAVSCCRWSQAAASASSWMAPWMSAIYLTFCAMSAWVIWQDLISSL